MGGFTNSDGSALVGGLSPSNIGQALRVDAAGNLLVNSGPQRTSVALWADNPASTGVNTDQSIQFGASGTSVSTLTMISNTSPGNILYEWNTATTSGSDVLQPGQKVFLSEVGVTSVHVQAPVSTPINAANGVIIRGWA